MIPNITSLVAGVLFGAAVMVALLPEKDDAGANDTAAEAE